MSGGYFDYDQFRINDIVESLEQLILNNNKPQSDGYSYHYSDETIKQFKIGVEHLRKAFVYTHRIDWFVSGDDAEDTFHERLKEDLTNLEN